MVDVYKNSYGNADSRTHDFGDNARKLVETARGQVAELIGRNKDEKFFTSGSTESNNIVIFESVKELARKGFTVDYVKPDYTGRINANDVISLVTEKTLVVSIMHVNNETGVI